MPRDEQATDPLGWPQVVIVYERGVEKTKSGSIVEVVVYSSEYTDYDCGQALEDCRAKYGNSALIMGDVPETGKTTP